MNYFMVFLTFMIAGESYGLRDVEVVINEDGTEVDTEVCPPDGPMCFIKCCGQEQVIYETKIRGLDSWLCVNKTNRDLVDLSPYKDQFRKYSATMSTRKINETFLYKKKQFFDYNDVITVPENEVEKVNNSIETEYGLTTPRNYCYDMIVNGTVSYYAYLINLDDTSAEKTKNIVIAFGFPVSAFFIFVTLIIHYLVKKLRQNMYIYLLMQFMSSLMLLYLLNFVIIICELLLEEQGRFDDKYEVCLWLSPISYFLLLVTFFWMNAMCFEIWRNLSKMKVLTKKKLSVRAKICYGLYAVGCPAALTAVAVAIDFSDAPENIARPYFGECMHNNGDIQASMYKYLPIGVLVFANIMLYSHTIYRVCSSNRLPQGLATTQLHRNREHLRIYISLTVLMGINWILECIQILGIPDLLVYIIDTFNGLIGITIFFITVFKRSIFVELCKRFNIDHRWVRESRSSKEQSSKNSHSKGKSSYVRSRTTDDSIQFESINVSQDLDKITPLNPNIVQTTV